MDGEVYVIRNLTCPNLDRLTALCTVFHNRQSVPWCLPVKEAILQRAFPADCPYVQGLSGYQPPMEVQSLDDIKAMMGGTL
jgi:uncharacterized cysteine cluster protein YcgN (CxxCxxCC family)